MCWCVGIKQCNHTQAGCCAWRMLKCGVKWPRVPEGTLPLHVGDVSLLQHTWFKLLGCYQASEELDDEPIIWIRCVYPTTAKWHSCQENLRTWIYKINQLILRVIYCFFCHQYVFYDWVHHEMINQWSNLLVKTSSIKKSEATYYSLWQIKNTHLSS